MISTATTYRCQYCGGVKSPDILHTCAEPVATGPRPKTFEERLKALEEWRRLVDATKPTA